MRVRPRLSRDLEALVEVAARVRDRDGYPAYLPHDDFHGFLTTPAAVAAWVAEVDDTVVGHVALNFESHPAAMAVLRGAGIAGDLRVVMGRHRHTARSRVYSRRHRWGLCVVETEPGLTKRDREQSARHRPMQVPSLVTTLRQRADEAGFPFSCEDITGELLAVLSAAVRPDGRILEIGTGIGVGLGWIVAGLDGRNDVSVVTIEQDPRRSAMAQGADWPAWVQFVNGDAIRELPGLGSFDLIFADSEGGKWYGLDLTLSALSPGGMLVLDDLVPQDWKSDPEKATHHEKIKEIRRQIHNDSRMIATEMTHATGLLLAVRQPL